MPLPKRGTGMNTFNHIRVAKFVLGYVKKHYGISICRRAFIWGNIRPDFGIDVVAKPHYIGNYMNYIQSELIRLSEKNSSNFFGFAASYRLGVICHYCTDFFCFAHNIGFEGTSMQHVRYERKLNQYCKNRSSGDIDFHEGIPADIKEKILDMHEEFMHGGKSLEKDWLSSLEVCILSILYVARPRAASFQ